MNGPSGKPYLPCQETHVVIYDDRLGAAVPEPTSPAMKRFNRIIVGVVLVLTALVIWATGVWMGATDPTLWNYVPGVEEPPTVYVPAEE